MPRVPIITYWLILFSWGLVDLCTESVRVTVDGLLAVFLSLAVMTVNWESRDAILPAILICLLARALLRGFSLSFKVYCLNLACLLIDSFPCLRRLRLDKLERPARSGLLRSGSFIESDGLKRTSALVILYLNLGKFLKFWVAWKSLIFDTRLVVFSVLKAFSCVVFVFSWLEPDWSDIVYSASDSVYVSPSSDLDCSCSSEIVCSSPSDMVCLDSFASEMVSVIGLPERTECLLCLKNRLLPIDSD